MAEPKLEKVLARDVVPHEWSLWCAIEDGEPFANPICHVAWSEDGYQLVFMLDSFNFLFAKPDEEIELVRETSSIPEIRARSRAAHAKLIADGPPPAKKCAHCDGTGKVRG